MKTINSLSGGKTSSYLTIHYPADYNVFALVTTEDIRSRPKDDALIKMVSDKIGREFIATAESDLTLKAVIDLEQLLGKEIIWLVGDTFEQTIKKHGGILPNFMLRFCTHQMKMKPIFDWCTKEINEIVEMRVGYRYDELERADRFTTKFKTIIGRTAKRNKWGEIEWRIGKFPLIEDKVTHLKVKQWAESSGLIFPSDSNCVGCFHKPIQQLRKNFEDYPEKMNWFAEQEIITKKGKQLKWKKEMTYSQIKSVGLQTDFNFGTGSGCQAGFCTD